MLLLTLFAVFSLVSCSGNLRMCSNRCKQTCTNPFPKNCASQSSLPTCRCSLTGYVYANATGKCIPISECPNNLGCNGDPNAIIVQNPSGCPRSCQNPEVSVCNRMGLSVGCVCKPGYILNSNTGKCVLPDKCPCGNPCKGNTTFANCVVDCPSNYCPVDDSNAIVQCLPPYPCLSGCVCKYGYTRNNFSDRKCIQPQKCSPFKCTRPNEEWSACPPPCFSEGCGDVPPTVCNTLLPHVCRPACICKPNYQRDQNNECIPVDECPPFECTRPNEEWSACPPPCFSEGCGDVPPTVCNTLLPHVCKPACICKPNYQRDQNNECIPVDECPSEEEECGVNEYLDECASICPIQSCTRYPCDPIPGEECRRACRCIDGYLRDDSGNCIPASQCPNIDAIIDPTTVPKKDANATTPSTAAAKVCPHKCKPTCSTPNPPNCSPNPACQTCKDGYIYPDKKNNTCIPIYQCPQDKGCNDDKNAAIQERVIPCRSTCQNPSQSGCSKPYETVGCMCKSGYILSGSYGRCITINKCHGGNPCGRNETFVSCVQCRFDACPTGDTRRYGCDPIWPCPAGCVCADGYRRYNGNCIVESECPPVPPSLLDIAK